MGLVLVIEKLGTITEINSITGSLFIGISSTLFILGMLIPCVGKKGAIAGAYSCMLFLLILITKDLKSKTSIKECNFMTNQTISITSTTAVRPPLSEDDPSFFLFRVSMFYYSLMGIIVGITAALMTSYFANEMDAASVNPDYLSPVIQRFA